MTLIELKVTLIKRHNRKMLEDNGLKPVMYACLDPGMVMLENLSYFYIMQL